MGIYIVKNASLISCAVVFLFTGCHESLPLRSDPLKIFSSSISADYSTAVSITEMTIMLNITNVYDETLQEPALLEGLLKIQWLGDPRYGKTVILNKSNLRYTPKYNSGTGIITIDPGDTLHFIYKWNFTDDNGDTIPKYFRKFFSPRCLLQGEKIYVAQESFILQGSMGIFKQTGFESTTPITYSCCYAYDATRTCSRPTCQ